MNQKPYDAPRSGWQRFTSETGAELKRLAVLGSYEAGAALQAFPPGESAYRGDLGMLTSQAGQIHGPQNSDLQTLQAAAGYQPHVQPDRQNQGYGQSP